MLPLLGRLLAAVALPHPVHASAAELVHRPALGMVELTIRVFADDFPFQDPVAAGRYLAARFRLIDRGGRDVALILTSRRTEGPMLVFTLRGGLAGGLAGTRIWHGILAERFPDQVNVVRLRGSPRAGTLVFTARDGPKAIP